MALQRVEIDKDKVLVPGDRIEMHFRTVGLVWLQAAQIALIEYRIGKRKDFRILSNSLPANNRVIFTIEIIQPPADQPELQTAGAGAIVLTVAKIAGVIIALGVVWLTLDKTFQIVEKIVDSPGGKVAVAGTGIGIAAAGIAALLYFLPKGK